MKKLIICLPFILTSCIPPRFQQPPMTTAQYCGQILGLKYGTKAYANCGIKFTQLRLQAYNAQTARIAANNTNRPTQIYVKHRYSYY